MEGRIGEKGCPGRITQPVQAGLSGKMLLATEYFSERWDWDFPGDPVVKTSPSNIGGVGLIPGQGAKIPHASWPEKIK